MMLMTHEEMLSAAARCEQDGKSEMAALWRMYAAQCAASVHAGDKAVGWLSCAVLVVVLLASVVDAASRWLQ